MKKTITILFIIFISYSCATIPKQMTLTTPTIKNDNNAKIVFIRPFNFLGSAIPTTIIRVDKNKNVFYVGELYSGYGIIYPIKPGKHIFGISGERWTSLAIDTEANKFYYVRLDATPGFFMANFSVTPQNSTKDLSSLGNLKWITPNDLAKSHIDKYKDNFYKSWENAVNSDKMIYMQKDYGFDKWLLMKP